MKKNVLLMSMVMSLIICNFSFANDLESLTFQAPEKAENKISMSGWFSKSGIASPNGLLFSYTCVDPKVFVGLIEDFTFVGRTGDKTFEIIYKITEMRPAGPKLLHERKREKINLFFEENGLCPLSFVRLYSGCSNDEKVFLKMIKLQGNQFEYQIILPSCLKR